MPLAAGTAPVLLVPGLRDHVPAHWQTLLQAQIEGAQSVAPLERDKLSRAARVAALDDALARIGKPVILVAHSAGVLTVVHWARQRRRPIHGALLVTPPDFSQALPAGYPSTAQLVDGGWLPTPMAPLPFPSIVAASRDDPLAGFGHAERLAEAWGARLVDLGCVGHLNPAAGYGEWPRAHELIDALR